MADAVTALIGAIIMIGYILLIAAKLAAPPLWICVPDRPRADAVGVLVGRLDAGLQARQEITPSPSPRRRRVSQPA